VNWIAVGSMALALAVSLGAFGAHGLRGRLDEYSMNVFERAVFYHFIHALGILIVGALERTWKPLKGVAWLLLAGIVFFSGSLYLLAITGNRLLGAITPIGGVAFIVAWVLLSVAAVRSGNIRP
jgi:uncharacterized membrane protein YgdD (TMEM256/DUF423 family)